VLGAITFVEIAALMSQCWIFVRTDLYAVLITATGCVNLFRVNGLLVRRTLRLITAAQREELAEAHARDVAVARWYRWIYMLGVAGATAFFAAYFAPATIHLVSWIASTVAHESASSVHFWEAAVFGLLILCPRLLTLGVALRDLRLWRERRAAHAPAT
jgi:putative peptide zinc metalloprotease protein